MGIRFEVVEGELQVYRPDGERFASYLDVIQQRDLERQQAQQERQRAEQEHQRAEQAFQAQRDAIPKLLAMGLSVEQIAEALSLPVEIVRTVGEF